MTHLLKELESKQEIINKGAFRLNSLLSLNLEGLEGEFVDRIKTQIEELKSTIAGCEEKLSELQAQYIIDQIMVEFELEQREVANINPALVVEFSESLDYEEPGSYVEAAYSVDELISMDEGNNVIIDHEAGFVVSSLGIVSLFAGTITLFTMDS